MRLTPDSHSSVICNGLLASPESPLRGSRPRLWEITAAVVLGALALSSIFQEVLHRSYLPYPLIPPDFPHYYMAGRLARLKPPANLLYYLQPGHEARTYGDLLIDPTTPYGKSSALSDLPNGAVTSPFDAPPFAALMMEPLTFFHWQAAYSAWQLLSVLMLVISIYAAIRMSQTARPSILLMFIALTVALLFVPFKRSMSFGNIDVTVLMFWALGVAFFWKGRDITSACLFAIGTAIKVFPVFAVPLFVVRRQWRWLLSYLSASIILLAASMWELGWRNYLVWIKSVAPALSCGVASFWNRSLTGLILGLRHPPGPFEALPVPANWCLFLKGLSGICYCAFLLWCWKKTKGSEGLVLELMLLPLVTLLTSPLSWPQHYTLAVLPLAYLWMRSREEGVAVSTLDMVLLASSSVIIGSSVPDFIARLLGPWFRVLLMGAWAAAAIAPVWVGMRIYGCDLTNEQGTARA